MLTLISEVNAAFERYIIFITNTFSFSLPYLSLVLLHIVSIVKNENEERNVSRSKIERSNDVLKY